MLRVCPRCELLEDLIHRGPYIGCTGCNIWCWYWTGKLWIPLDPEVRTL